MQITNCRIAIVNASTIGSNQIVAAPGTGGLTLGGPGFGDITVWQVVLNGSGANVLTFQSGTGSPIYGPIVFTAAGSSATLQATGVAYFRCRAGEPLVLNLSTGAAVTGSIYWTLG